MFRGFSLKGYSPDDGFINKYKPQGRTVTAGYEPMVRATLKAMAEDKTTLDGTQIRDTWFPQVAADIFLSHSHRDLDPALALAGWLKSELGLTAFVDSSVWGYAAQLLKLIDDKYCLNPGGETYCYEKRNDSTSHVHAMLSTALAMMIDKTECLLFLSTPQSVSSEDVVKTTTKSPWIYTELLTASIVAERVPDRYQTIVKGAAVITERAQMELVVQYAIPRLDRVKDVSAETFNQWREQSNQTQNRDAHKLDVLYRLVGVLPAGGPVSLSG